MHTKTLMATFQVSFFTQLPFDFFLYSFEKCFVCIMVKWNSNKNLFAMPYLQYCSSFEHFRHECRHSFQLAVACSNARQYSIDNRDLSFTTWHKTAELSQQHHDTNLHTQTQNLSTLHKVLQSVCLYICLLVSQKTHVQTAQNLLQPRLNPPLLTICYELPVLWTASFLYT